MMGKETLLLILLHCGVQFGFGYVQRGSGFTNRFVKLQNDSSSKVPFIPNNDFQKTLEQKSKKFKPQRSASSSRLFYSSGGSFQQRRRIDTARAVTPSEPSSDGEKTIIQKIYHATLGRLKSLIIFVLKVILLNPFKKLRAMMKKDKNDTSHNNEKQRVISDVDDEEDKKTLTKVSVTWDKEKVNDILSNFEPLPVEPTIDEISDVETMNEETGISTEEELVETDIPEIKVVEEAVAPEAADEIEEKVIETKVDEKSEIVLDDEKMYPEASTPEEEGLSSDASEPKKVFFADEVATEITGQEEEKKSSDVSVLKKVVADEVSTETEAQKEEKKSLDVSVPEEVVVDEVSTETKAQEEVKVSSDTAAPVEDVENAEIAEEKELVAARIMPTGDRWAVAASGVDLSGTWKLIASDTFKKQYDCYLKNLGQPSLVRSVAVSIVEMTSEEVVQKDEGRSLCIKGKNLRGVWERTLESSGSDFEAALTETEHTRVPLLTADKERVEAEAWWEKEGTSHISWLRGVKKVWRGRLRKHKVS
jgi:hypothetical protein